MIRAQSTSGGAPEWFGLAPIAAVRQVAARAMRSERPGHTLQPTALVHEAWGDNLFLTESPDGFRITPYDPEFEAQMSTARDIMKRDRSILRELAK